MNAPIIEILLSDKGEINYRLRPTILDTKSYGQVLAEVVRLIGAMMESEGNLPSKQVVEEIARYFSAEIETPTARSTSAVALLQ